MKIIIVGAGISGLSTYLHLRKHLPNPDSHTITIYESHQPRSKLPSANLTASEHANLNLDTLSESTAIVGGGLGISPNGMRVLRDLDPTLHDAAAAQGFATEHFIFRGANGWTLGKQKTDDKAVRPEGDEVEVCIASSRYGLWETLIKSVTEKGGEVKYRKVVSIEKDSDGVNGRRIRLKLVDGYGNEGVDDADLLVGADGVKSVVRTALFSEDKRYKPTYTGLSGVGGFLNQPIPSYVAENKAMVFTFGGNGNFGYSSGGPLSADSIMWWSTFETSCLPDTKNVDPAAVKSALLQRHHSWKDPIVRDIISKAEVESIYPTWVLDHLPHWGEQGIVLIGDAAHAMDPTSGQGASQALEDSQTLALLLAELLKVEGSNDSISEEKANVDQAIKILYDIRSPRVRAIVERTKKIAGRKGNVGVVGEYVTYFFLWLLNAFPSIGKAIIGDTKRELYAWSAKDEIRKALEKERADVGA